LEVHTARGKVSNSQRAKKSGSAWITTGNCETIWRRLELLLILKKPASNGVRWTGVEGTEEKERNNMN